MMTTTVPADKQGRPSLILVGYDRDRGEWANDSPAGRVVAAVRAGNYLNAAAAFARLNRNTVFNWLARGREAQPEGEWERSDVEVSELPYVDFLGAIAFADGAFEVELVTLTLQAAREDKKFALSVLGRKYGHWRESTKLTVTDGDEADALTAAALHADPALVAKAAALAHEIEDARVAVAIAQGEMPLAGKDDDV